MLFLFKYSIELTRTMIFYLFIFLILHYGESADPEFRCTTDFCLESEAASKCPTFDLDKCTNQSLAVLVSSPMPCTCCETCFIFQGEGDTCTMGAPGQPMPQEMCGPGLKCQAQKCVKMDPLEQDPLKHDSAYICKDDVCNCIDKDGNPIFGTFPETAKTNTSQYCACSALANQVQNMPIKALPFGKDIYQPFARCLPNGNFDPLQCYEGFCNCIDVETGEYDVTIPPVSIWSLDHGYPLCYNETLYNHTRSYYRDCQKDLLLLQRAKDYAEADGFQFLFPFYVECRPDGEYLVELTYEQKAAFVMLERLMKISGHTGLM